MNRACCFLMRRVCFSNLVLREHCFSEKVILAGPSFTGEGGGGGQIRPERERDRRERPVNLPLWL